MRGEGFSLLMFVADVEIKLSPENINFLPR
jgi:hypothetical protein